MAKKAKPFHMHALTKASAKHLHKHGHISKQKHNEIVKHADKNMDRLRKAKAQTPAPGPAAQPMAAATPPTKPGVIPTPPPGFDSEF
jgi:hypothetical protein